MLFLSISFRQLDDAKDGIGKLVEVVDWLAFDKDALSKSHASLVSFFGEDVEAGAKAARQQIRNLEKSRDIWKGKAMIRGTHVRDLTAQLKQAQKSVSFLEVHFGADWQQTAQGEIARLRDLESEIQCVAEEVEDIKAEYKACLTELRDSKDEKWWLEHRLNFIRFNRDMKSKEKRDLEKVHDMQKAQLKAEAAESVARVATLEEQIDIFSNFFSQENPDVEHAGLDTVKFRTVKVDGRYTAENIDALQSIVNDFNLHGDKVRDLVHRIISAYVSVSIDDVRTSVPVIGKSQQRDNEKVMREKRRNDLAARIGERQFFSMEFDESPAKHQKWFDVLVTCLDSDVGVPRRYFAGISTIKTTSGADEEAALAGVVTSHGWSFHQLLWLMSDSATCLSQAGCKLLPSKLANSSRRKCWESKANRSPWKGFAKPKPFHHD